MTEVIEEQRVKQFELVDVDVDAIELDPTNPNIMTAEQMSAMRKSMQQYGYLAPVILDRNNKICDGEHRVLVYRELGLKTIPAYVVDLDSDTDRKQLRQVMNKLHGTHDQAKDADELVEIMQASQDKTLRELSELIAQPQEELMRTVLQHHPTLDYLAPENEDQVDKLIDDELRRIAPDAKLGEVYQLGNHRLLCSDATDEKMISRLFDGKQPDIILTDPPYSSGGFQEAARMSGSIGTRDNAVIERDRLTTRGYSLLLKNSLSLVNADVLYLFTDWRMWTTSYDITEACGYPVRNMIVWDKMHMGMGFPWRTQHELILFAKRTPSKMLDGKRGNVLQSKRTGNVNHAVEKPVDLLVQLLSNTDTTESEGLVYDPFLGSGSTIIACEQLGRPCYGVEIDPHYVDITIKRWEAYTGQKAEKVPPT